MRLHPQRDEFLTRVLDLPPSWIMPFNALLFRFIDPQFSAAEDIISGEGSHWASGRWNLKGAMRVAYTATEPETALAECLAHARYYNLPLNTALPRVLVSLVLSATAVLDLRYAILRRVLHISLDEIIATDWRRENRRMREAVTQAWGAAFAAAGVEALITPSAASDAGTNIVVFPENLRHPDEFFVEREVLWH
jgi:RES domain-containing protein